MLAMASGWGGEGAACLSWKVGCCFADFLLVNIVFFEALVHFPGNMFGLLEMKPRSDIVY